MRIHLKSEKNKKKSLKFITIFFALIFLKAQKPQHNDDKLKLAQNSQKREEKKSENNKNQEN